MTKKRANRQGVPIDLIDLIKSDPAQAGLIIGYRAGKELRCKTDRIIELLEHINLSLSVRAAAEEFKRLSAPALDAKAQNPGEADEVTTVDMTDDPEL